MILRSTIPSAPADLQSITYDALERSFEAGITIRDGEKQSIRLCPIGSHRLIVKRYRNAGILAALRILLRRSRPHRSMRYARYLRNHGIHCPAHLLVLARYSFFSAKAYLLIEYVSGPSLFDLVCSKEPQELPDRTAQAIVETVRSFHSLGLSHGDLHTQNLIIEDTTRIQVIDLDNVRKTNKRQGKDLDRLESSISNGSQNTEFLLKQIAQQLKK